MVAGPVAANTLPQTLRSWCGVPVASLTSTATPADLAAAANAWADDCKVLVLVTQNESGAEPFLSGGVPISAVATVTNTRAARARRRGASGEIQQRAAEPDGHACAGVPGLPDGARHGRVTSQAEPICSAVAPGGRASTMACATSAG